MPVNTYNGFEQSSLLASYAATPGELTRVSFLDLDGDVVFAEFGGNGKLTISFEQHESGQSLHRIFRVLLGTLKGWPL